MLKDEALLVYMYVLTRMAEADNSQSTPTGLHLLQMYTQSELGTPAEAMNTLIVSGAGPPSRSNGLIYISIQHYH